MASSPTPLTSKPDPAVPAYIRDLPHYDPAYPYDWERYEYDLELTSDPYYVAADVKLMSDSVAQHTFQHHVYAIVTQFADAHHRNWFAYVNMEIHHMPAPLLANTYLKGKISPDLSFWGGNKPTTNVKSLDYRQLSAPPLAIMEAVSDSSVQADTVEKKLVYARWNVPEYWIYDPEGPSRDPPCPELQVFRLDPNRPPLEAYLPSRPSELPTGPAQIQDAWYSPLLQTLVCWRDERLQYWKPEPGVWAVMAHVTEDELQSREKPSPRERREEGRKDAVITMLAQILDPHTVAYLDQVWTRTPPDQWPDLTALLKLQEQPGNWRHLLLGHEDKTP